MPYRRKRDELPEEIQRSKKARDRGQTGRRMIADRRLGAWSPRRYDSMIRGGKSRH
jgi:hypothetical protein